MSPLWHEMRYGSKIVSHAYVATRFKTFDGLIDSVLGGTLPAMKRFRRLEAVVYSKVIN